MSDPEEGFLQRWSRRKRGEGADQPSDPVAQTDADFASEERTENPDQTATASSTVDEEAEANRKAAEAVDLDSLTADSDFTVFMKRGVPAALKTAALRKLWRSDPVFAVLDGLNDYDENFRTAQLFPEGVRSAWKVGEGYREKAEQMAAEKAAMTDDPQPGQPDEEVPSAEGRPALSEDAVPLEAAGSDEQSRPDGHVEDPVNAQNGLGQDGEAELERGPNAADQRVSIRRRMRFSVD
ncbi:uncharacterized protein DUF3306 [Roseibium hamelinense]|uniref:Uncharacterized protein DUF3306 n=1 Tax=Roseibium hamelinense TaxID=150831 RepID=A0A562T9R5_9HYPH|nr:DUF3306 domain-containing protein [Roseibium hamelinense]MTI42352.1 DUF3306 domain-containing protein [Roseibium hamelinense]TWI89560.1 uncharacterized protein DUF3306 [Roseibium hamelinense]